MWLPIKNWFLNVCKRGFPCLHLYNLEVIWGKSLLLILTFLKGKNHIKYIFPYLLFIIYCYIYIVFFIFIDVHVKN